MRLPRFLLPCFLLIAAACANAATQAHLELITDHSGASQACGPVAVRWGFMCPIVARFGEHVYALNFTRPADVPWDTLTPIEAPVAFWSRNGGKWTSLVLDCPKRTYQTPTLLISPDGRANVFTLHPAKGAIQWFHATDSSNSAFDRTQIPMQWGSYMSGAIDRKGRAALVYWGGGPDYARSTLACTLLDTTTGQWRNFVVDTPGAPYCYNEVFLNETGLHIFGIKSELSHVPICGTTNHYTELRYYHCADPEAADPVWRHVVIVHNDHGCFQPLGNLVDPAGRVHLLYQYEIDDGHGNPRRPWRLVYAVSREPVTADHAPEFVQHELDGPGDGRLFLTRDGSVHILAYTSSTTVEHARVLDAVAGRLTKWEPVTFGPAVSRVFPIDPRSGSTPSDELAGVVIPPAAGPEKNSIFYFSCRPPAH